ncbi:MAG: cytochrome c biogenesis protein CcdA [Bacteroidota bacterium]
MKHQSTLFSFFWNTTFWCTTLLIFWPDLTIGQIYEPVKWEFYAEQEKEGFYLLHLNAEIEEGWAVYSQYLERDDGPIATSITFEKGAHFELIGQAVENPESKKEGYDAIFDMNLAKFFDWMEITQRVKVYDSSVPITGYLTFMTCNDRQCLPPDDIDFSISFSDKSTSDKSKEFDGSEEIPGLGQLNEKEALDQLYGVTEILPSDTTCDYESVDSNGKAMSSIFFLGLLGGFLALLTPCVFPLIPITVSFFTKSAETKTKGFRNAFLYGFFILLVYLLLSSPFHLLDGINPDILNEISTNVWLNILFFIIFLVFAFSFFGFFEINMPSTWTNRVSAAEGVGGVLGIFFMALTLSLVSFSCTGPILGSLLAGALSSDEGAWQLTAGMGGFGLALALPFGLFAMFPSWLSKIPKSGGWHTTVKVTLGFIEIALAFKFLSNADLVMHWGLLRYELFMAFWILTALLLGLYLLGIFKSKSEKSNSISLARRLLGFGVLVFTIYLCFGLSYNENTKTFKSLKVLSGLAPPAGYSWIYPSDCPNGLACYKDLQEGIAYATSVNKPVLLDFTGYACVNCRKMEEHVWSEKKVYDLLNDEYVLVSLYVDDKEELDPEERMSLPNSNGGIRKLRNVGHKWAYFQTRFFETNAQPFYVAVSPDGLEILNYPVGYTPEAEEYISFLECGISEFSSSRQSALNQLDD